jgi:hypothetical protein
VQRKKKECLKRKERTVESPVDLELIPQVSDLVVRSSGSDDLEAHVLSELADDGSDGAVGGGDEDLLARLGLGEGSHSVWRRGRGREGRVECRQAEKEKEISSVAG